MSISLATELYESGKAHGLSSCLLYRAAIQQAEQDQIEDKITYALNGPYSLSIQYLLGLGFELMLKCAIVAWDDEVDTVYLRDAVGHDLITALDEAESRGFLSQAPYLRDILATMRRPYRQQWFRYKRPSQFNLPGNFNQVTQALSVLDTELATKLELPAPSTTQILPKWLVPADVTLSAEPHVLVFLKLQQDGTHLSGSATTGSPYGISQGGVVDGTLIGDELILSITWPERRYLTYDSFRATISVEGKISGVVGDPPVVPAVHFWSNELLTRAP